LLLFLGLLLGRLQLVDELLDLERLIVLLRLGAVLRHHHRDRVVAPHPVEEIEPAERAGHHEHDEVRGERERHRHQNGRHGRFFAATGHNAPTLIIEAHVGRGYRIAGLDPSNGAVTRSSWPSVSGKRPNGAAFLMAASTFLSNFSKPEPLSTRTSATLPSFRMVNPTSTSPCSILRASSRGNSHSGSTFCRTPAT